MHGIVKPQLETAIQVYEEALQIVPSAEIFKLYAKFLMNVIAPKAEDDASGIPSCAEVCASRLSMVYEKAETMGCMTEDLACGFVSFCWQLGEWDEARKLAEKLCNGKFSDSLKLCLTRASIEIRLSMKSISGPSKADLPSIFEFLKSVLTRASLSEAEGLWLLALKFFAKERHYFDKLIEISLITVTKYGGRDGGFSLPSAIVNFVLQRDGIQQAREIYKRFLALPHPGLPLCRNCIELEGNLASVGDKDCLANARQLYEYALTTYDQNVSLWRDYYAMEIKLGTSETATAVCWRARKTLKDAAAFVALPEEL